MTKWLYNQLNPRKTHRQAAADRDLMLALILLALLAALFL